MGRVRGMNEYRNACSDLMENPVGKRPLGRPGYRWKDNVKMDLKEMAWMDVNWIELAEDWKKWRVFFFEYGNETSGSMKWGNFLTSRVT